MSGPITHCPDGNFLLGPAPGLKNYWMCCGASIGITQGPGAGKYLAQWMVHGQTEINMLGFDPRRYGEWSAGSYALEKSIDEYQQMYQVAWPGEYREDGRPVKTTADPRQACGRGGGVRRKLRLGASQVVRPARGRGALQLPPHQLVRAGRRGVPGGA